MANQESAKLLSIVKKHHKDADFSLIERAFEFAAIAHEGQTRMNGASHFSHSYATALLLANWRMPPLIVAAGLLHDVPEDTLFSLEDIEKDFGKEIASLVAGETKLGKLKYRGSERYAENLRKMFLAFAQDIRVVIIKFADRIDNLKTLPFFPPEKQKRIALESLEIYAAIANRLGMGAIRRELEDNSFKYLYPKEYEWVTNLVKDSSSKMEHSLKKVKEIIKGDLDKAKVKVIDVSSRTKGLYSLYKKLLTHDRDISQIYDIIACRIIVESVADCYAALGIVHSRWKPFKGRIKDYIAFQKPNGYQSLHTTVFCEQGELVEFQIRTERMHEEAEFGIAAHWFYKEKGESAALSDKQTAWIKELAEIQKELQDKNKFLSTLDSLKMDFFQNRIFIFTPRGDVVDLPEKATPVDFAYAIHTDLGNKCSGARVNDQIAPLNKTLLSGDMVEIIVDKNRKGPSSDWLKFVQTHAARTKIREQIKKTRLGEFFRNVISRKK